VPDASQPRIPRPVWLTDAEAEALRDHLMFTAETDVPGPRRDAARQAIRSLVDVRYADWWRAATTVLASVAVNWRYHYDMWARERALNWMDPTADVPEYIDPEAGQARVVMDRKLTKLASDLMDKLR
jgi:hypothetical protein